MSSGKKHFYLVRHGESEANVLRMHGGNHHALSEKGKEQARQIAKRFSKLPVEAVYSSELVRAEQTAQIIAEQNNLPLETAPDLSEVAMPSSMMERSFDTPEAIKAEIDLIENMRPGYKHSDEESFDEMVARAGRVLDWFSSLPQTHIGIVTHGLFLRCLIGRAIFGPDLSPRELLSLWRGLRTQNTGLTILEYRPDTPKALWRVYTWNDHAHLG